MHIISHTTRANDVSQVQAAANEMLMFSQVVLLQLHVFVKQNHDALER